MYHSKCGEIDVAGAAGTATRLKAFLTVLLATTMTSPETTTTTTARLVSANSIQRIRGDDNLVRALVRAYALKCVQPI